MDFRRMLRTIGPQAPVVLLIAVVVVVAGAWLWMPRSVAAARVVPPPALDVGSPSAKRSEVAVLAGGCFWGVQGVFQHVKGVASAVSGYAGGAENTARYEMVETATTGH